MAHVAVPSFLLRALGACVLAGIAHAALAQASTDDIVVRAEKHGEMVRLSVDCPVRAPAAVAWQVLTDFDGMAKFVTNLTRSEVRMRMGNRLQVYQKGQASRGPLKLDFENVREIDLVPQTAVRSRMIEGNMMPASFETRIEERDGVVHVLHTGTYTPSIWVPPVLGTALIEAETRKQYGEIRAEILRRAAGK